MQSKPARAPIVLESPSLRPNGPVPRRHTAQGADVSPALTWRDLPPDTKQIVVALEDRDTHFPGDNPFLQWVAYNIPATATGLPEHLPEAPLILKPRSIADTCQALTRYDITGYRGPQPPPGEVHHYRFVVYALDAKLALKPGLFANAVMADVRKHIIGEGEIKATYKRTP